MPSVCRQRQRHLRLRGHVRIGRRLQRAAVIGLLGAWSTIAAATNFVVIVTDDQRFDSLWAMPGVTEHLIDQGVSFDNAYATLPLCCPFRASFLAGGYHFDHAANRPETGLPDYWRARRRDTPAPPAE